MINRILILYMLLLTNCAGPSGPQGTNGLDGSPGATGPKGLDGSPGSSCTVQDTDEGAIIICDDGSQADVRNGQDGDNGAPAPSPKPYFCECHGKSWHCKLVN